MAEDKKEEITPEVKTDVKVETPPEVSIEDLQKLIQERDSKILEQQRTISRHAESERKLKDQSETLAGIYKRLDDSEELQATMLDHLEELRGEPVEEARTSRKSHRQELEERRKAQSGGKKEVPTDPDVTSLSTILRVRS